jgi:hypothetical protein
MKPSIAFLFALALAAQASAQTPLTDMGATPYLGFSGRLYENSTNILNGQQLTVGLARAAAVQPLDTSGNPSPTGKMVLLSVGMSNTSDEFCGVGRTTGCDAGSFIDQTSLDSDVNHTTLVICNGAQGGQTASAWESPTAPVYNVVRDQRLTAFGATEAQVQVVWLKEADADPTISLPDPNADAYALETHFGNILRALKVRYPNIQQVFFSSRIYAGYATTPLNPEPYAYESGFAVKWIVQAQVDQMRTGGIVDPHAGDLNYNAVAPWIAWGPYLWANGTTPRSDGLVWLQSDFQSDGTHPSASGVQKVGAMLLSFFKNASTTRPWFLALSISPNSGPGAGGSAVTITGNGFQAGATLMIGGSPATGVTVVGPTQITASTGANPAGTVGDLVVTNPSPTTFTRSAAFLSDYADVPSSQPFHDFIATMAREGVTGGCGGGDFCAAASVSRSQMAVFLLRAEHGAAYAPPAATGIFTDVPLSNPFAPWIERIYNDGVTGGCATNPLMYCPANPVTRDQMATFLLAAEHGSGYAPPACTPPGQFTDVPCPGGGFTDWIYQFVAEGITGGCTATTYCPTQPVSRAQMSVFLVTTFGLP